MAETLYQLRILGLLPEAEDREAVRQSLALLFKTTPEKADVLLQQPTVLRKLFNRKAADRLHLTLRHAGIDCQVEPAEPESPTPTQPHASESSKLEADGKPVIPLAMDPLTILRPATEAPAEPTEADWRAFIGPNADSYLAKHQRMRQARYHGTGASFQAAWHWPAFFVAPLWFWYRRLYGWALLALLTSPLLGLSNILWGSLAHRLYYQHARNQIRQMRRYFPDGELQASLAEVGGVLGLREALPQATGVSLALGLLGLWLFMPAPVIPEADEAIATAPTPQPRQPIQWQSASQKPIYIHEPRRLNNQPPIQVNPYREMRGVTQTQVQKQPQTPEAKTAQRMSLIKRRLHDFLVESRQQPIPKDFTTVEQVTELARETTVDGWGQPWHYQPTQYGYELTSSGADKQLGTEDDIWLETNPRMPVFMRRERDAAIAARLAADAETVQPLQLAPEE